MGKGGTATTLLEKIREKRIQKSSRRGKRKRNIQRVAFRGEDAREFISDTLGKGAAGLRKKSIIFHGGESPFEGRDLNVIAKGRKNNGAMKEGSWKGGECHSPKGDKVEQRWGGKGGEMKLCPSKPF